MVGLKGQLSIGELSLHLIIAFPLCYVLIRREGYGLLNDGYPFVFYTLRGTGVACSSSITEAIFSKSQHWHGTISIVFDDGPRS